MTYQWRNSSTNISGATTSAIKVISTGTYNVVETNSYNCSATSSSATITVNALPVVSMIKDTTINTNESVTIDAGTGFKSYLWSTGNTNETLQVNGSTIGTGTFKYYVTVTNSNSCSASDSTIVTVTQGLPELTTGLSNLTYQNGDGNTYYVNNNRPNPFNEVTYIDYYIPENAHVTIKIYNLLGQEITTLVNEIQSSGKHYIKFSGNGLANGIYTYKLVAISRNNEFTRTKLMILNK